MTLPHLHLVADDAVEPHLESPWREAVPANPVPHALVLELVGEVTRACVEGELDGGHGHRHRLLLRGFAEDRLELDIPALVDADSPRDVHVAPAPALHLCLHAVDGVCHRDAPHLEL